MMNFFDFHHHNLSKEFGIYNLRFGEKTPANLFSAGIHPNSIDENLDNHFFWLKEISLAKNCVAIGECGLDGRISVDEKLQEEVFLQQISLANQIKKPLIIHCVRRFHRLIYFQNLARVPLIIHGFNKRKSIGEDLLKHHFYLSFGKSVLYDVNLQEFIKDLSRDRIFIESDSAEVDLQEIYEKIASLKNIKVEDLVVIIQKNLQKLQISI